LNQPSLFQKCRAGERVRPSSNNESRKSRLVVGHVFKRAVWPMQERQSQKLRRSQVHYDGSGLAWSEGIFRLLRWCSVLDASIQISVRVEHGVELVPRRYVSQCARTHRGDRESRRQPWIQRTTLVDARWLLPSEFSSFRVGVSKIGVRNHVFVIMTVATATRSSVHAVQGCQGPRGLPGLPPRPPKLPYATPLAGIRFRTMLGFRIR
jgi:hypothetical protein